MGRFSLAVRDYLDTCDASAGLLSKKYHPTEQGAVKVIFHRDPGEADQIRAAFRDERHRSPPSEGGQLAMPAPSSRSRSRSPYPLEELTVTMHRSALGAWWRWRTELLIALVLVPAFLALWARLGSWAWPLVILGGLALVLIAVPWSRRFLATRFWVLFTRHRLQRAFWELRLHTRAGRLPLIAWITATPVGTRAMVICRAGMCLEDFEDNAAEFASACGAREARVTCSARWSWLIFIDIIRRDVLGPARVVRSPLAALPGPDPAADTADVPAWPEPALAED